MSRRNLELYEAQVAPILRRAWEREGESLMFDPHDSETNLGDVLDAEGGSPRGDPDELPADVTELHQATREDLLRLVAVLMEERDGRRRHVLQTLLDFLFAQGPDPVRVAERIFMVARAVSPDHTTRLRQWEAGALFGQSKQNWQHMEERMIEDLISRYSRVEFTTAGGKGACARAAYSAQKRGNRSRKCGRRKGDERP